MSSTVHNRGGASDKLGDQAASAALYATSRDQSSKASSHPLLDDEGRLSSAGAATSLKYARAQDLPSFPSQGGVSLANAGAAASLAEKDKKHFEHWKPGAIPAANKAAQQAKDYEMDPLWQPQLSAAGSKAALLAHKDTVSPNSIYTPSESEHGLSAAGQALINKKVTPAITERQVGASDHRKALLAATGAMAGSRRRAESAPIKPQTNSTNWALKAATSSHKSQTPTEFTTGDPGFEASRIQNVAKDKVNRQMYGSAPPVALEVEEKNRQAMLRASAVAMAQKMYAIQQTQIDDAKTKRKSDSHYGANVARNRALSDSSTNSTTVDVPPRYENLEEAARRLAHERLAKLHDEHAEYRQYYGATSGPQRSKISVRNRRRATSLDADDSDDEEQSRRIMSQMSIFQSKLAEVDSKKRQADRDALLQAAHKNVTAQMNKMDEKVFADTGKTSPQQRELWERQARERAQRESDERMVNVGKVNVGGGKYMDQSEVDAIARARLQPTLDDITEKAEQQRARDEEIRLEQERLKREAEAEKVRQADIKQEQKTAREKEKQEARDAKNEERRVRKEKEAAEKNKRDAEILAEKEKAKVEKEEKRKSKDNKSSRFGGLLGRTTAGAAATGVAVGAGTATAVTDLTHTHPSTAEPDEVEPVQHSDVAPDEMEDDENDRPVTATSHYSVDHTAPDVTEDATQTTNAPIETAETQLSNDATVHDQVTVTPADELNRQLESTDPVTAPGAEDATLAVAAAPVAATMPPTTTSTTASPTELVVPVSSPSKPIEPKSDSKVKSWFKSRFRTSSKAQNDLGERPTALGPAGPGTPAKTTTEEEHEVEPTTAERDPTEMPRSDSMRDVALAGRISSVNADDEDMYGADANAVSPVKDTHDNTAAVATGTESGPGPAVRDRSPSISSLSDADADIDPVAAASKTSTDRPASARSEPESEERGRKGFRNRLMKKVKPSKAEKIEKTEATTLNTSSTLTKPNPIAAAAPPATPATTAVTAGGAPTDGEQQPAIETTNSNDKEEEFEEARDTFEEQKLAPPPKLSNVTTGGSPRGSRERSKFTEDL